MAEVRISAEFTGMEQAVAELERAEAALTPPSLTESMGEGADVFVETMKTFVPKDSGLLESVIDKKPGGGEGSWIIGPVLGSREETPYANIQNEGGTNVGNYYMYLPSGARFHTVTIPGTQYVQKALEGGREAAIAAVKEAVLAQIRA